jgi:NAD(P)-dependent dehydrogenase (short-subunit alcohol dehydrogenase family)
MAPTQTADLSGRIILLTGARVKIGFECGVRLLRCGAIVIASSRFPHDCVKRYAKEPDFEQWKDRLHVVGLDLRDLVRSRSPDRQRARASAARRALPSRLFVWAGG